MGLNKPFCKTEVYKSTPTGKVAARRERNFGKMSERRDPNNVPLNEDFLQDLPDRKAAERNSVYNAAGGDTTDADLQNLPDRQIAERNSVYKLANKKRDKNGLAIDDDMPDSQQDFGDSSYSSTPANIDNPNFGDSLHNSGQGQGYSSGQGGQGQGYSSGQGRVNPASGNSQMRQPVERGSRLSEGSGYPVNTAGADKNVNVVSEHGGPGFTTRRGQDAGDQLGYRPQVAQAWGDKENQLPETVSLNEQGYNGPSKLDGVSLNPNTTQQNQVGFKGSMLDADRPKEYTTQSQASPTFGTDSQVVSDINEDPGYRPS